MAFPFLIETGRFSIHFYIRLTWQINVVAGKGIQLFSGLQTQKRKLHLHCRTEIFLFWK